MKHVFFELLLHLGFLLCHLGCRLTKCKYISVVRKDGKIRFYQESEGDEIDN